MGSSGHATPALRARIVQVNVSPQGGLPKRPVQGPAWIRKTGVEGDFNRYRQEKLSGDPDSAVLLVPLETVRDLAKEGYLVEPGSLGENLTTEGVRQELMAPGQVWEVGEAEIQISRACTPCHELEVYGARLVKEALGRRGWYARVLREGRVTPGDAVVMVRAGAAPSDR